MRSTWWVTRVVGGLAFAVGAVAVGCSGRHGGGNGSPSSTGGAAGVDSVSGGDDAEGGESGAGSLACTPTGIDEPDDGFVDADCDGIDGDASNAVFVSPDGEDQGDGSIQAPLRSIQSAIEIAVRSGRDVYVCSGAFAENVVVDDLVLGGGASGAGGAGGAGGQGGDGGATGAGSPTDPALPPVRIVGGYDCQDWRRGGTRATIKPSSGVPLTLRNLPVPVVIDHLSFLAPLAEESGESSIAAIVAEVAEVTFNRVALEAQDGAEGTRGEDGAPHDAPRADPGAIGGASVDCPCDGSSFGSPCTDTNARSAGGWSCPYLSCNSLESIGGPGGAGSRAVEGSTTERPALPGTSPDGSTEYARTGGPGANGDPGAPGTASAENMGSIVDGAYAPTNSGTAGASGTPGKGGGGGGGGEYDASCRTAYCSCPLFGYSLDGMAYTKGSLYRSGGGGQGGRGGSGGRPGKGGGGGGGSIALLVTESRVNLVFSSLTTANGGRGGAPGAGGSGQTGGLGGKGGSSTGVPASYDGYDGGPGGNGGPGGVGGPGGGGPSVCVLYQAGQLEVGDDTTCTPGRGGDGGTSLAGGPDGETGAQGDYLEIQ